MHPPHNRASAIARGPAPDQRGPSQACTTARSEQRTFGPLYSMLVESREECCVCARRRQQREQSAERLAVCEGKKKKRGKFSIGQMSNDYFLWKRDREERIVRTCVRVTLGD